MSTVLAVAGLLLLLVAVHPFTTYPLSLMLLARLRARPLLVNALSPAEPPLRAAFCLSAYNEEHVIRAKVENMLSAGAPGTFDVLIYVDGASDGTAACVREYGDKVRLVASDARLGKTHGMNTLVAMTGADILVFSDANVLFAPEALPALLAPFADPTVGCVCGHLVYTSAGSSATAATGSVYWRLEEAIKTLESATGSVMGADGSIFALRRSAHERVPADLIDDMYVSLAALCNGHRIVRTAGAVAYEEAVSRPGEEFRRKIRIACQAFNVHRALWPRLRKLPPVELYKYVSHKLIRWLTAPLQAAGGLCLLAALATAEAWWLFSIALLASAASGLLLLTAKSGARGALRSIMSAFIATGIGVWRSCQGDRFQTWNPPSSARTLPNALSGPAG